MENKTVLMGVVPIIVLVPRMLQMVLHVADFEGEAKQQQGGGNKAEDQSAIHEEHCRQSCGISQPSRSVGDE
jgi:hypothetical protein